MIDGFVLAGGDSKRLGRDKSNLLFKGRTLLDYSIDNLSAAGFRVRISAGNFSEAMHGGIPIVTDRKEGIGPLGGIYSSLLAAESDYIIVHSCDTPLIPGSYFTMLPELMENADIVVPADSGRQVHLLSGSYSQKCLPKIIEQINRSRFSVRELMGNPDLKVRLLNPIEHGMTDSAFLNINTEEDYQELLKHQ